jgi:protein transport protein SEC9
MFGRKKKSTNPFEEEPSAPPPSSSQYQKQEKSSAYTQRYPSSASQTQSPPPSYRSHSQSDLSDRDQLFGDAPSRSRFQARNQYNSSESVPTSDRYGGRSRYNGSSQYGAGYDEQGQQDAFGSSKWGEDEADQEVSGLKQQIRNVKQDTLASSRNAVQKIREAEEASGNTMNMLGEQSSKLPYLFSW